MKLEGKAQKIERYPESHVQQHKGKRRLEKTYPFWGCDHDENWRWQRFIYDE